METAASAKETFEQIISKTKEEGLSSLKVEFKNNELVIEDGITFSLEPADLKQTLKNLEGLKNLKNKYPKSEFKENKIIMTVDDKEIQLAEIKGNKLSDDVSNVQYLKTVRMLEKLSWLNGRLI